MAYTHGSKHGTHEVRTQGHSNGDELSEASRRCYTPGRSRPGCSGLGLGLKLGAVAADRHSATTTTGAVVFVVIGLRGLLYTPRGTEDMKARVKNLKLQAKTAIMIIAPKKAKALLWVVATKPLPVRLRSSVGVRRDGRASRIVIFW